MKRLVVFCEGYGDEVGVITLAKRLLTSTNAWSSGLHLDDHPFRTGDVRSLFKGNFEKWGKFIGAALKRPNLAAILAVFDGDIEKIAGQPFCAKNHATILASAARRYGAGSTFSLAVVFARQEFESWLIAGVASLAGQLLPPNNRPGIKASVRPPDGDLEVSPRGAKEWLSKLMADGYNPTRDQGVLAKLVAIEQIQARRMRSFHRLESAIVQLTNAIQSGTIVTTP